MKVKVFKRIPANPVKKFYNLEKYQNTISIIEDYTTKEQHNAINADVLEYLNSFEDFECFVYYVVNNEYVIMCDSVNGDVLNGPVTIDKFIYDAMQYASDEINK